MVDTDHDMLATGPKKIYIYKKVDGEQIVLKDLLHILKKLNSSTPKNFSYIEAKNSLHPSLSLWENLTLETSYVNWNEFEQSLKPDQSSLIGLIKEPTKLCSNAQDWEKFIISFFKGFFGESNYMLMDVNESVFWPNMIKGLKKNLVEFKSKKAIILATANISLWEEHADIVVTRDNYEIKFENISSNKDIRKAI